MKADELERQDAVIAVADLVGRSGGREFEVGYLHENVPAEQAGWYATVTYRGGKLIAENQAAPEYACDLLAHRILDGGTCQHCLRTTTTTSTVLGLYVSARPSSGDECVWHREGPQWKRGCE